MAYPTKNTNVVGLGLSRLTSQFRNLPNIRGLLTVYLNEVQAVENALWDVFTLRNIASGQGDQLDQIGKIVGQPRDGLDDPSYRLAIQLRVLANKSGGRTDNMLKIALLLAQEFTVDSNGIVDYQEAPNMGFSVGVWNQTYPQVAASLLSEARAATSRGIFYYSTWPKSQNLMWGSHYTTTGQGVWSSTYGGVSSPDVLVAAAQL